MGLGAWADSPRDVRDWQSEPRWTRDRGASVVSVRYLLLKESKQIPSVSQGRTGEKWRVRGKVCVWEGEGCAEE